MLVATHGQCLVGQKYSGEHIRCIRCAKFPLNCYFGWCDKFSLICYFVIRGNVGIAHVVLLSLYIGIGTKSRNMQKIAEIRYGRNLPFSFSSYSSSSSSSYSSLTVTKKLRNLSDRFSNETTTNVPHCILL